MSIYNWEDGKARPRAQHLPAIFALRNLGRREANEIWRAVKRPSPSSSFGTTPPNEIMDLERYGGVYGTTFV